MVLISRPNSNLTKNIDIEHMDMELFIYKVHCTYMQVDVNIMEIKIIKYTSAMFLSLTKDF